MSEDSASPLEFRAASPDVHELRKMDEAERAHVILSNFQEFRSILMDQHVRILRCQRICKSWHGTVIGWMLGVIATGAGGLTCYVAYLVGRHVFGGG